MRPGELRLRAVHASGRLLGEVFREHRDVFLPFPKRWNLDGVDVQAVIEVLTEPAFLCFTPQILVRCGDQPSVDRPCLPVTDALELSIFQNSEEFALERKRDFSHLVEKERPLVSQLKTSCTVVGGAGKGTLPVTEELAFVKLTRDRGAIDLNQGSVGARAAPVKFAGDQFLACA